MNNKMYICEDCLFVFQLHTKYTGKGKVPFCPHCGENVEVRRYKAERITKRKKGKNIVRIRWTDEELELLDRCIAGDLEPHQVAIKTGRSINSILKRKSRRKTELAK